LKTIGKTLLLSILVIVLVSCSSFVPEPTETPFPLATTEKPSTNSDIAVFVYDSDILNATIEIHPGWETKDNENIGGVFVVDNWKDFTQGDPFGDAISILFLRMQNGMGSASSSLDYIESNLDNEITKKIGDTNIEEQDNLEIAWSEYIAKPPIDGNGSEAYYLLAVITDGKQSISALATVYLDRQDEVKPIVLEIIKRVKFR
jgi:hypothetical protein